MHLSRVVKKNWLGVALIAVTWLIFFSRVIFDGQVYFFDDLKVLYYPIEHVYSQFQSQWQLPIWSPLFGFGQPLIAWGQLGFFTPLHLLLRLFRLHPLILLNTSTIAYIAIGLAGMHAFLRHQKLNSLSAALGAIVFGFCGFTIGHLNHVNFTTATMLLPWLLLAVSHFIARPTLPKTALLAVVTAAIPLSGQPQISLYTFVIAGIFGVILFLRQTWLYGRGLRRPSGQGVALGATSEAESKRSPHGGWADAAPNMKVWLPKVLIYTSLAGVLAFSLASFSILPLKEFLPSTDRSGDLSITELYEFSYPPSHAITLLFPYYFGDHELYRGAKNFQELAAYVGIIPLLLAPLGLWPAHRSLGEGGRRHIALRTTGLLLIIIALIFTPGIYSPIYRFLVENHILTSLTVPGRFVYFFDVGIALLAALGLETIDKLLSERRRLEASIGIAAVVLTAANLIWWGWDYNPLTSRTAALKESALADTLEQYQMDHGLPPRLYAHENLPLSGAPAVDFQSTEPISPNFTVHQPIRIRENVSCLAIPFTTASDLTAGEIILGLRSSLDSEPFFSTKISSAEIIAHPVQRFCIPKLSELSNRVITLTLTSDEFTNIQAFQRLPTGGEHLALYVRVPNPTAEQLARSRKTAHLVFSQDQPSGVDLEKELLLRHMNVTADTSAARWIGALSIGSFRTFIDSFFANDRDPIDGEGMHALVRHRNLLNMSGITHLIHSLPDYEQDTDPVLQSGYVLADEAIEGTTQLRLYTNPEAFPKAFLVGSAIWEPGPDQTRDALSRPDYDGRSVIFVTGPTPPEKGTTPNAEQLDFRRFSSEVFERSTVTITRYEPAQVDIDVTTAQNAWLVLTDSYTPQWHTSIDNIEAPQYIANTVFRAAYIPAGSHIVSFRYDSPAIQQAKNLTIGGLIASALLLTAPHFKRRVSSPVTS